MTKIKIHKFSNKKNTTLYDFYTFYSYKPFPKENTIPRPYYNKSEYTNNKFTLPMVEWKTIIEIYLNNLEEYLLNGNSFQIPNNIGQLKLYKCFHTENKIKKMLRIKEKNNAYKFNPDLPTLYLQFSSTGFKTRFANVTGIKLAKKFRKKMFNKMIADIDFTMKLSTLKPKRHQNE